MTILGTMMPMPGGDGGAGVRFLEDVLGVELHHLSGADGAADLFDAAVGVDDPTGCTRRDAAPNDAILH
ncbi:unnamed protein product [Linum trigynum]|uniref:Uncharacterized protein n=1 Tax=Linum trigynum TaxID=586398 RepID=A0AAV2E2Y1_9ROSI